MKRDQETLLRNYKTMVKIGKFEQEDNRALQAKQLFGNVQLCIGEAEIAAGVCA